MAWGRAQRCATPAVRRVIGRLRLHTWAFTAHGDPALVMDDPQRSVTSLPQGPLGAQAPGWGVQCALRAWVCPMRIDTVERLLSSDIGVSANVDVRGGNHNMAW